MHARAFIVAAVLAGCGAAPKTIVPAEQLGLLATCEALAQERDRAWEAAWTWDDQIEALRVFWEASQAAGCEAIGPEWRV